MSHEQEAPEPDEMPRPEQYDWSRDAVTLARLLMEGDNRNASELMLSLIAEPRSLPVVFQALAGMIGQALETPQGTDPAVFIASVRQMLEDGQQRQ